MGDDGIGFELLNQLKERNIKADFVDLGTDVFRLRLFYDNHSTIIFLDALNGGGRPGDVLIFSHQDFENKLTGCIRDVHHIGFYEALKLMKLVDLSLAQTDFFLVGIVAEKIESGLELSQSVKASIPHAVDKIISLIQT
jgi:hydrogenase maturation protease